MFRENEHHSTDNRQEETRKPDPGNKGSKFHREQANVNFNSPEPLGVKPEGLCILFA